MQVSKSVAKLMFSFDKNTINGFFRRTLKDLETFWIRLNRNKILSKISKWFIYSTFSKKCQFVKVWNKLIILKSYL